jgi:hypothetical protein
VLRINKQAQKLADKQFLRQKIRYDERRKKVELKIGDKVLWESDQPKYYKNGEKIPKKFQSKRHGPFEIIGKHSKNVFTVRNCETGTIVPQRVHSEKLVKFYQDEKIEDKKYLEKYFETEDKVQKKKISNPSEDSSSEDSESSIVDYKHRSKEVPKEEIVKPLLDFMIESEEDTISVDESSGKPFTTKSDEEEKPMAKASSPVKPSGKISKDLPIKVKEKDKRFTEKFLSRPAKTTRKENKLQLRKKVISPKLYKDRSKKRNSSSSESS